MFEDISSQPSSAPQDQSLPKPPTPIVPTPHSSHVGKKVLMIFVIILLLVALGFGGYMLYNKFINSVEENPQVQEEVEDDTPVIMPEVEDVILNEDTDRDGLTDDEEDQLGTSKISVDTDEDGLSDFDEVKMYKSDPLDLDTDGDGFSDGSEVENGYDPVGEGKLLNFEAEKNSLE